MLKVKDLFARKNDVDSHVDYLKGIVDALVLVQDDLESLKSLGDVGKVMDKYDLAIDKAMARINRK